MDFIVKKTTELSDKEISQILSLFEKIFEKERSKEIFLNQSIENPLGFSYHSMMIDNDEIVGLNTYVPGYFKLNGLKVFFANSTDSMVDKPYRDFFNFKTIFDNAYKELKKDGISFVYGYPTDNSHPVLTKSKLMKDIGKMYTYCLPVHVGNIKKSMKFLNPLSYAFCRGWIGVSSLLASKKGAEYRIEKEAESYNETRYKRGDGEYEIVKIDDFTVFYKIKEHEGIRTAFLIDITKKSPKNFVKAVKHIIKNHRKDFDLLLYPGYLNFKVTGMIKIPRKFEPKNFYFVGKALDKSIPEEVWDIRNWDTNLSNYDLI